MPFILPYMAAAIGATAIHHMGVLSVRVAVLATTLTVVTVLAIALALLLFLKGGQPKPQ